MKFYIALGGIGCNSLMRYAEKHAIPAEQCFYMDIKGMETPNIPEKQFHGVSGIPQKVRNPHAFGRLAALKELYCGQMKEFFRPIFEQKEVSLNIFTSSFGGFGGAIAFEIMDYLQANTWGRLTGSCNVYAVTESVFRTMGFPKFLMDLFESNTYQFVQSFRGRMLQRNNYEEPDYTEMFNPQCCLWLSDGEGFDEYLDFSMMADWPAEKLRQFDKKEMYMRTAGMASAEKPEVFISYSSLNEELANLFVDTIEKRNHRCWIAHRDIGEGSWPRQIMEALETVSVFLIILTEESMNSEQVLNELSVATDNIRNGLHIIPFLVSGKEVTKEVKLFLTRQEIFFGNKPPLVLRIEEVADRIVNLLEKEKV